MISRRLVLVGTTGLMVVFHHFSASLAATGSDNAAEAMCRDLQISGVFPHLTTYGNYSEQGRHSQPGHDECGIGAIVPWAGSLWMVNYAPHRPMGSEHKLFSIDPGLNMTVHPESVGGTPAGRMIHRESNQLLIGHHLIDAKGRVRTIAPADMPMRVTAIARHLSDPENSVYYIDMEGAIWEANVRTLEIKELFQKPVPGWHGKGGYTGQGRLVIANNGESPTGKLRNFRDFLAGNVPQNPEDAGVLAEWDGQNWRIIERRQFTDITGPDGIHGGTGGDEPLWAIGWDRRSLRFKLLDDGRWSTYLLPKAALCNDARHGWYTEWPRIRQITDGRWMMDMHGMFFEFPKTFSRKNSAGIVPISSHLRYIPDFCEWNGKLVLATNETSIQGNPLAGQPQSNLWFGSFDDLKEWGPASGYGGPWIQDTVAAGVPSDPFLVAGFDRRFLHLAVEKDDGSPVSFTLEVDVKGDENWTELTQIAVAAGESDSRSLPEKLDAVWLRFTTNRDCVATAFLHQAASRFADGNASANRKLFAGLAGIEDENALGALVYAAKRNRNLHVVTQDGRFFDFTKTGFEFEPLEPDPKLKKLIQIEPEVSVDEASVVLEDRGVRLRLPKGNEGFDALLKSHAARQVREVQSERHLANLHGTFYEVPLLTNGAPPAYRLMRPVSSHSKRIVDFCSWNGLLVLTGVRPTAENEGHIFSAPQHKVALWLGGIDDLWKLGKPVGKGGPWKETLIRAGEPSDPYLMTGYDKKRLQLIADADTTIAVEVDFDHQSGWHKVLSLNIKAGVPVEHEFEDAFSAHWIRFTSTQDCTATATLIYE